MKKLIITLIASAGLCAASIAQVGPVPGCPGAFGPTKIIRGTGKKNLKPCISNNTTWHHDTIYILKGIVRVAAQATLTIKEGTIVMAFPGPIDTSALIINKGARLISKGTSNYPIVMTSCKLAGTRNMGDWGGLVLCGNAPNNKGINVQLEGNYGAVHGGTDPEDNSGNLQYMRVEFAGFPFAPNQELNGITLGSVGAKTIFQYIQVSHSGDDSFEWFGGSTNGRYLLSYKPLDDDFDTDQGYSGINQFGIAFRDNITADFSGSNSFESDNDATGSNAIPKTAAMFSNFTCFGPILTETSTYNKFFKTGALIRRNSETDIYNSVFIGFPGDTTVSFGQGAECCGVYIKDGSTANNALSGLVRFKKNIVTAYNSNLTSAAFDNVSSFNSYSWFISNSNTFSRVPYNYISQYKAPSKQYPLFALNPGSMLLSGSSFTTSGMESDLPVGYMFADLPTDRGFRNISHVGASSCTEWANETWTEYNPNFFKYTAGLPTRKAVANNFLSGNGVSDLNTIAIYPNPAVDKTKISFFMDYATTDAALSVLDMKGDLIFVQNSNLFAGENNVDMNTTNLEPGMYIVRVSANGTTAKTAKLNVVR